MSPSLIYSLIYFVINAGNAVSLAFFPLHCKNLAFTPLQIGLCCAAFNCGVLLGAPGFSWLAYSFVSARRILLYCSLCCVSLYVPVLAATQFSTLIILWFLYAFLWSGCSVTIDTRAMRESLDGVIRFEVVRMWGSIGFIFGIALLGEVLDHFGVEWILRIGFLCSASLALVAYVFCGRLPAEIQRNIYQNDPAMPSDKGITFIGGRSFFFLLLTVALCWTSHGALYVYYSIYLRSLGWSGASISFAWNVGVVAEVILFLSFSRIRKYFSLHQILAWSAFITVIRWFVIASTQNSLILFLAQILHAFSFGSYYLASIKMVHEIFPQNFRDRAQGILLGVASGGGSLLGRTIFGVLASRIPEAENYDQLFYAAALLAVLALFAALAIPKIPTEKEAEAFA